MVEAVIKKNKNKKKQDGLGRLLGMVEAVIKNKKLKKKQDGVGRLLRMVEAVIKNKKFKKKQMVPDVADARGDKKGDISPPPRNFEKKKKQK